MARHFVAYHNTAKMGRTLVDGNPLAVVSNKPLQYLHDNVVWFVQGDSGESKSKSYSLASAFVVSDVHPTSLHDFKWSAAGAGHVFDPPIRLNEIPWFADLFKTAGHFGLGVCEIKDATVIAGLTSLATDAGWSSS